MGVFSELCVVADLPAFVAAADEGRGSAEVIPEEDRSFLKSWNVMQIAELLAILRGVDDSLALLKEFPLLSDQLSDSHWVQGVPLDLMPLLRELDAEAVRPTAEAMATRTAEELGWSLTDMEGAVADLHRLAVRQPPGHAACFYTSL